MWDWYEAGGQVDAFETLEDGDILVTFRTRAAAEQVSLVNAIPVRSVDLKNLCRVLPKDPTSH